MKNSKTLGERRSYNRLGALKFAGLLVLFAAMSGLCAEADETMFATEASERTRTDSVDAEARKKVEAVEKRLKATESSLDTVELRLGRSTQPPTLTRNFERRVQEIERRLDAIERELKKMDALERDVKRMDDRLRRVENKR